MADRMVGSLMIIFFSQMIPLLLYLNWNEINPPIFGKVILISTYVLLMSISIGALFVK